MMAKALTIVLTVAALAVTLSPAVAGARPGNRILADARIIHVPQPGENTGYDDRVEPGVTVNEHVEEYVAPRHSQSRRRRVSPRRLYHSNMPPPESHRAVLSAPPMPTLGPSPIHPLPRYQSEAGPIEKFEAPSEAGATPSEPRPPSGD